MRHKLLVYLRRHHIALLALFIALGGTSYAAAKLPAGSVGTKQIKKRAVTPSKLSKSAKRSLKGTRGPAGAQGAQGPAGAQGPRGATGPRGLQGATGASGATKVVVRSSATETCNTDGCLAVATASCAAGERATGGGSRGGDGNDFVYRSIPVAGADGTPTKWESMTADPTGGGVAGPATGAFNTTYVVCAKP